MALPLAGSSLPQRPIVSLDHLRLGALQPTPEHLVARQPTPDPASTRTPAAGGPMEGPRADFLSAEAYNVSRALTL